MSCLLGLASLPAKGQTGPAGAYGRRPRTQEVWIRTELYFGTNRPGGEVSDEEFAGFVDREVTKRFPDGLTLLTGYGQFLNSQGVLIRERSKVLILFYPLQTEGATARIQEIREAYKTAFQQESVLKVESYAYVSF